MAKRQAPDLITTLARTTTRNPARRRRRNGKPPLITKQEAVIVAVGTAIGAVVGGIGLLAAKNSIREGDNGEAFVKGAVAAGAALGVYTLGTVRRWF